jgi:hypothetical protein
MSERDFYRDAQKALVAFIAGPFAFVACFLVGTVWLSYCAGQRMAQQETRVTALRDTVRIADSVYLTKTDTVVRYQRRVDTVKAASDALDSAVVIVNDSTVTIHDTVAVVPSIIVADIRQLRLTVVTQDTLIRVLYGRDSTQEWRIATRDKMIRELGKKSRPYSIAATLGYVCHRSCGLGLAVGLSYRIR